MIIRDITNYLQGKLSEDEAIGLWVRLVKDDTAYRLFEFYLLLYSFMKKDREYV